MNFRAANRILTLVVFEFASLFVVGNAVAQQVTGTLGQADATTTINGKQLPPPPPKFGGVIKETAPESTRRLYKQVK